MAMTAKASQVVCARSAVWAAAHAVNDGYPTLYLALLPVLMTRWHFGAGRAGLLAGLLAVTTQALQPWLGAWADRRGGPWFVVGGLLVGSLGNALGLAWASSYWVFAVVLMLGGLGNAAFHPHMAALVSQNQATHQGRSMGGWMVSGMIGHILAPLAVVALWRGWGWLGVQSLALPGLLAAFALYVSARAIPRPAPRPRSPHPIEWTGAWRRGRGFLALMVLRSLGSASLLMLLPIVWHQRGGSPAETGAVLALVYATGMVGNLLGGVVSDAWGARPVLLGSLVGASGAAVVGGLATTGTGWTFWTAVAVWGFAVNGAGAVMLVYGQSLFPTRLGMASGLTMGLGNTVGAFGAWAVGAVAQWRGTSLAIDVAAACLLAGVLPAWGMPSSPFPEEDGSRPKRGQDPGSPAAKS
ncbi:MAG: MFS transporter [Thermaerobacter sp.]|nr:MFS transporter [Thermaerobacter sp.]